MASALLNEAGDEEDDDLIILSSSTDEDTISVGTTYFDDSSKEAAPLGEQEAVSWYGKKPEVLSATIREKNSLLLGQCKTVKLIIDDYVILCKTVQNILKDCESAVSADDGNSVKNSHKVSVTHVEPSHNVIDTIKNQDCRINFKTSKNGFTGASAAKPKNVTVPDFKKNKGLVGMRIMHTVKKSKPDHQTNCVNTESHNVGLTTTPILKIGSPVTLLKSKGMVGTKTRKIMPLEAPAVQVSENSTKDPILPYSMPVNLSDKLSTLNGSNKFTGPTEKQMKLTKNKDKKKYLNENEDEKTDKIKQKAHPGRNKHESKKNKSAKDSVLDTANNSEHIRANLNIRPTVDPLVTEEMKKIINSENTAPKHIKILLRNERGENGSSYEIVLNSCTEIKAASIVDPSTKHVVEKQAETPTELKKSENERSKVLKTLEPTRPSSSQDLTLRAPYDNLSKTKGAKLPERKSNNSEIHYPNKTSRKKEPAWKKIKNKDSESSQDFRRPSVTCMAKTNGFRSELKRQSPGAPESNEPETILQHGDEDKSNATPQTESMHLNKFSVKIQSVSQINSGYDNTNKSRFAKPKEMPNFTQSDSAGVRIKEEKKEEVTGFENTSQTNIDNGEKLNVDNKELRDNVIEQPAQSIRVSSPMVQPKLFIAVKQQMPPPPQTFEPRLNQQCRPLMDLPSILSNANSAMNQFRQYSIAPQSNMPRDNTVLQNHDVHIPNNSQTQESLPQQPTPKASHTITQEHQKQRFHPSHHSQRSLPNSNNVLLNQSVPRQQQENGPHLSASQLNQVIQRLLEIENEQQPTNINNDLNSHEQHCAALMKWNNYYHSVGYYQQLTENGKNTAYWPNHESQLWSQVTHSPVSSYLNVAQNQNAMPNQDTYACQFYPNNSEYSQSLTTPSFTQPPPGMLDVNNPNTNQRYVSHNVSSTNPIQPSHTDQQTFAQKTSNIGASTSKCVILGSIKPGPTGHSKILHHNNIPSSAKNYIHPLKSNAYTNNAPRALQTVPILPNTTPKNGSKRPGTKDKCNSAPKKTKPVMMQTTNSFLQGHSRPVLPPLRRGINQPRKISLEAYNRRPLTNPVVNRTIDYSVDNYKSSTVTEKGESSKGRPNVNQVYGSDTTRKIS